MFRIRKILDNTSAANRAAIDQVLRILEEQFPNVRAEELVKLPQQLNDPLKYKYRSILFIAENGTGKVKGFAMLLHMPDIGIAYLELISAAPGRTGGGIGGALYDYIREECLLLNVKGLFFECAVDDPDLIRDKDILRQNSARLKFYERYAVYPVVNNLYATPVKPGDQDLYFLMMDSLGREEKIGRKLAQKVVRAILERKYGDLIPAAQIDEVVGSFRDDPLVLRKPRYMRKPVAEKKAAFKDREFIALVVNEGHNIHHTSVSARTPSEAMNVTLYAPAWVKSGLKSKTPLPS